MNIRPSLIANPQSAELAQPRQRPLNHPPIENQPAPMLCGAFGQDRPNPEQSQRLTMRFRVIDTVSQNSIRLAPRTSSLATNHWNGRDQGQQLGHNVELTRFSGHPHAWGDYPREGSSHAEGKSTLPSRVQT